MLILGIDPGSRHTGYGVVRTDGTAQHLETFGVLDLDATDDHELRLKQIYDRLTAVIERALPDVCAIEMPIYGRNPQSMLKLGRAQAAAMLAAINRQIPVTQYTPKEVKKAVTGTGNASKEQVAYMVQRLLAMPETPAHDAADAIAVALCHAHRQARPGHAGPQRHTDWSAFVRANPGRLG